jgi:hypothetical protein
MDLLAMPSLIAQAATPSIGAALLGAYGVDGTLATLTAVAVINFILAVKDYQTPSRPAGAAAAGRSPGDLDSASSRCAAVEVTERSGRMARAGQGRWFRSRCDN